MLWSIQLPVICFFIIVYNVFYFRQKMRLQTLTSRNFTCGIISTLVHALAETMLVYTQFRGDAFPAWFSGIWMNLYFVSWLIFYALVLDYIYLYFERRTQRAMLRGKQVLIALSTAGALAVLVLPASIVRTPTSMYCAGAKMGVMVAFQAYALVTMFALLVRYRHVVIQAHDWILFGSPSMFLVLTLVQLALPAFRLSSLALALVVLGTMVSAEDAHAFTDFTTGLYNERGVQEVLQELLLTGVAFDMVMYCFVGTNAAMRRAMRSVGEQLPKRRDYACGKPMGDLLVLFPTRMLGGVGSLPDSLPRPRIEDEGSLKYAMTTVHFPAGTTAKEIRRKAEALRNQFVESQMQRDEVTGLIRRAAFTRRAEQIITAPEPFTFMMLDLDNFKQINDTYGHQIGDQVLKGVADAIRAELRATDLVCRIGGDEYAAVLPGVTDQAHLLHFSHSLQTRIDTLSLLPDETFCVRISVGAKVYAHGSSRLSFEEAYGAADAAMYKAKQAGKNQLHFCA